MTKRKTGCVNGKPPSLRASAHTGVAIRILSAVNLASGMEVWYIVRIRSVAERKPMRLLFELDKKDYGDCTHTFRRDSARSILIRDGKLAMIHSQTHDCYKFPGGGIEAGEDPVAAMIRETREEAGLLVLPETVTEYGYVHRIQKSLYDPSECFVQDNYYYLCDAMDALVSQALDAYEKQEAYRLEFVAPAFAIEANRRAKKTPYNQMMLERETRVLELLLAEKRIG